MRMWAVAVPALNRLAWNEPRVAAAAASAACVRPSLDVRRVLIGHADGLTVQTVLAGRREVKDLLVAVVHEPLAVNWLVVADRHVFGKPLAARGFAIDRDRFHPVNGVLQLQPAPRDLRDLQGNPGIRWAWRRRSGRAIPVVPGRGRPPGSIDRSSSGTAPGHVVLVASGIDSEVRRRGGHDNPDRLGLQLGKHAQTVAVEPQRGAAHGNCTRGWSCRRVTSANAIRLNFGRMGQEAIDLADVQGAQRACRDGRCRTRKELVPGARKPWATRSALTGWLRWWPTCAQAVPFSSRGNTAVAADIPVSSGDAAAAHRREPEQPNETHRNPSSGAIAIAVPGCY